MSASASSNTVTSVNTVAMMDDPLNMPNLEPGEGDVGQDEKEANKGDEMEVMELFSQITCTRRPPPPPMCAGWCVCRYARARVVRVRVCVFYP